MSINGYCPNCKNNLDGELVIDTFREMYKDKKKALETCTYYAGYQTHLLDNRWNRAISVNNWDRHQFYVCPDCGTEFGKALEELK